MKKMRTRVPSFLDAEYFLRNSDTPPRRLVVLLHGYEQSGQRMLEKLQSVIPSDRVILAPNGPFPLPRRTETGYRLGFSWYFWNPITDEMVTDMDIAVGMMTELISRLGFSQLPTTLIGFSQGGYLAPFLAHALPQVDHIIGLGAEYLVDEIPFPICYRADAIHGAKDEVVSPQNSQKNHAELIKRGAKGEFVLLSETGHRIDASMQTEISRLINLP
jgi:predicted esterase